MSFASDLYNSLNNTAPGFSAKKLSALVAISTSVVVTYRFTNSDNLISVLMVWLLFALFMLGFVRFAELIQFKNGTSSTTTEINKTEIIKNETTSNP